MYSQKTYYDEVLKPSEPPEFTELFERWLGKESDFERSPELRDEYLKERQFAFMGWMACSLPDLRASIPELCSEILGNRPTLYQQKHKP